MNLRMQQSEGDHASQRLQLVIERLQLEKQEALFRAETLEKDTMTDIGAQYFDERAQQKLKQNNSES